MQQQAFSTLSLIYNPLFFSTAQQRYNAVSVVLSSEPETLLSSCVTSRNTLLIGVHILSLLIYLWCDSVYIMNIYQLALTSSQHCP